MDDEREERGRRSIFKLADSEKVVPGCKVISSKDPDPTQKLALGEKWAASQCVNLGPSWA